MKRLALLLSVLTISTAARAQSDARPDVLILGTFHMANPGHDIYNMKVDDVLSPKRQEEMTQLIEVLKRFRPTKIAVEADITGKTVTREYADYLAGKYTLSRNEIDQVGYRLAKELGHKMVYAVDVDGDWPQMRVANYAKANGLSEKFDAMMANTGRWAKEENDYLASHTVLEMMEYLNSDSMAAKGVALYSAYARFGEPWEYAGPDLLASWYQRNIRIYHNIGALVESPSDRILVIYGAGHLGWLRQDVTNEGTARLRTLADVLVR